MTVRTDPDEELAEEYFEYIDQATILGVYYYETAIDDCTAFTAYSVATIATGVDSGGDFTVPVGWLCAWADFYWVENLPGVPDEIATECYGDTTPQYVGEGDAVNVNIILACEQYDIGEPE